MKRLKTKKLAAPRASSANWPQPLTYLVYAPLQHSLISSQRDRRAIQPWRHQYITVPQAANIIEAVSFAKLIGLPLVAHLTIHWASQTSVMILRANASRKFVKV